MTPVKPQPRPLPTCWDCGEINWPDAKECWLCGRRDWRSDRVTTRAARRSLRHGDLSEFLNWVVIVVAGLLLLWTGLAFSPWVLKPVLVLLVAAVLTTWARARGGDMTGVQFVASVLFLAVVLPALLLTSLVAALWLICASGRGGPPFP
jgi:4-hydroxybenzoate polyprenyltransferase